MNKTSKMIGVLAGVAVTGATVIAFQKRRNSAHPYGRGLKMKKAVTINRPADELYRHWRNLESLPPLIRHLRSVEVDDERNSTWSIALPGGMTATWQAEITVDRPNEMIGWRSLSHSDIDLAGYVRFEPTRSGRGTVVRVALQYNPPAGKLGAALATLVGERPGYMVKEALRRFKQLMETGEYANGGRSDVSYLTPSPAKTVGEPVQEASEESFPASDAPAWTGTTGVS